MEDSLGIDNKILLRVSVDALQQLLFAGKWEETRITALSVNPEQSEIALVISHPHFPEAPEGVALVHRKLYSTDVEPVVANIQVGENRVIVRGVFVEPDAIYPEERGV